MKQYSNIFFLWLWPSATVALFWITISGWAPETSLVTSIILVVLCVLGVVMSVISLFGIHGFIEDAKQTIAFTLSVQESAKSSELSSVIVLIKSDPETNSHVSFSIVPLDIAVFDPTELDKVVSSMVESEHDKV